MQQPLGAHRLSLSNPVPSVLASGLIFLFQPLWQAIHGPSILFVSMGILPARSRSPIFTQRIPRGIWKQT